MAERKIRNMEIRVDRPLATEALRLQARLMRAAGGVADQLPDLIGALRSAQSEEAKQAVGVKFIGVLTGVFEGLEPDEFAHLVGDIVGLAKLKRPSGLRDDGSRRGPVGRLRRHHPGRGLRSERGVRGFFLRRAGQWQPRGGGKGLTNAEVGRIAPNLNMWLWRPILADPPIYKQADLRQWVTLQDVMDAHEALDLKGAMQEKTAKD